jgi:hypothetical protein
MGFYDCATESNVVFGAFNLKNRHREQSVAQVKNIMNEQIGNQGLYLPYKELFTQTAKSSWFGKGI